MSGTEHVGNPDAAEHELNAGQGFKRVIAYGSDGSAAQPIKTESDGTVHVTTVPIYPLLGFKIDVNSDDDIIDGVADNKIRICHTLPAKSCLFVTIVNKPTALLYKSCQYFMKRRQSIQVAQVLMIGRCCKNLHLTNIG